MRYYWFCVSGLELLPSAKAIFYFEARSGLLFLLTPDYRSSSSLYCEALHIVAEEIIGQMRFS